LALFRIPDKAATQTLAGIRITLKLSRLHQAARIVELPNHPGDASYKKAPQDASPNLTPPPQLIEKEELKTSCL
jgi:hypothetical protein